MAFRRGQISLFLVIGIVFLAIGLGFVYLAKNQREMPLQEPMMDTSSSTVTHYVESCLEELSGPAILFTSIQGGYYQLPQERTSFLGRQVPIFLIEKNDLTPRMETLQGQISKYVDANLGLCLNNLSQLQRLGIKVSWKNGTTDVQVGKDIVIFEARYPIDILEDNKVTTVSQFSYTMPNTRLQLAYETAKQITIQQAQEPYSYCISCAANLTSERNLSIDIGQAGNNTIVLTLKDFVSKIQGNPLLFSWAIRYPSVSCDMIPADLPNKEDYLIGCVQRQIEENYNFTLENVVRLEAKVGNRFNYTVRGSGYNLTFTDYTDLFEIGSHSGRIEFTPTAEMAGNRTIWISVKDWLGNEKQDSFVMHITK